MGDEPAVALPGQRAGEEQPGDQEKVPITISADGPKTALSTSSSVRP